MLNKGFIALHRKFLEWQWFTDVNTCHLFLYCLVRANYRNTDWHGLTIKKGQFVTSLRTISSDTGLSLQQVRTSLKKLTQGSTHELTHESHSQYSIITVKNYNQYQNINTQINTKSNKQITTDNNINKRDINKLISLSIEERELLKNYLLRQKRKPDNIEAYIKTLVSNGDCYELIKKERKRLQRLEEKRRVEFIPPEPENETESRAAFERAHKAIWGKTKNVNV